MRCPHCQNENYEGAKFCLSCGCLLPRESPAKKFFMAALHALLYVALFMGIQLIVSFAYSFILSMSMSISHLAAGGTLEGDALTAFSESIVEIINNNLHTMMLLSGLLTILTLVISFRLRKKNPVEEMHIRKIPLLRAPWYLVFGVALQPVTNLLLNFLPTSLLMDFEEQNALADATGPLAVEILNVVILTPIVEELIFRGLAFTRLRRGMSIRCGPRPSRILFVRIGSGRRPGLAHAEEQRLRHRPHFVPRRLQRRQLSAPGPLG